MNDIPTGSPESPLPTPAAIRRRRSHRHFKADGVPDTLLDELIALTVAAPSSWNLQPWRIVVVRDADRREQLTAACYHQPQVREAPVSFVFAISHGGWREHFDEVIEVATARDAWAAGYVEMMRKVASASQEGLGDGLREYNTKDALIAATHCALAAESLGLGSAFMNGYDENKVKTVIGAEGDDDIGVSLVMPIGYPADAGKDPGRLPLARTVFEDRLDRPWSR